MTKEEEEVLERKKKRKEQRNIQKELKERQSKRLWEAQSIQRKLNEVEVKMSELDERANQVEKDLRSGTGISISLRFFLYVTIRFLQMFAQIR